MRKTLITAIAGGLLTVAFAAGCGSSGSPKTSAYNPPATNTVTPTQSSSAQVQFGTAAQGLKADLQVIAAVGPTDYTTMADACTTLGGDVDQAVNLGPYPNASSQALWSKALTDLKASATECVAGVQNQDSSLLSKTGTDMQAAQGELETAMTAMGGQ